MKHLPIFTCALFAAGLCGAGAPLLFPARVNGFDVEGFGRLPALAGGRVKPIDSIARNALLVIRGKQSVPDGTRTVEADEWLLDVLFRPAVADQQPLFVVDDPEVLGLLGLRQTKDRYFTFAKLAPQLEELERQASLARTIEDKQRSRFQGAVINLFERLLIYYRLRNTVQLGQGEGLAREIEQAGTEPAAGRQALLVRLAYFRPLPPRGSNDWRSTGEALAAARARNVDPGLAPLAGLAQAWSSQDATGFNDALIGLRAVAAPGVLAWTRYESHFNRAQLFYSGMILYLLALLLLFASWAVAPVLLRSAALALFSAGAVVHTLGLVCRIVLQGRPPVTNLYSSAIFVGWVTVIAGLAIERLHRKGFAIAVASVTGFLSLLVAHHLSADGDTLEMMRAVLDSNFWLATHVTAITIGYSGTFLAGATGIGYVLRHHCAERIDPLATRSLVSTTYGLICFSIFFSFVGTVLGGIWADQSWGRFWGWDPKENGALLIVLWNAFILHARWGGFVRERGLMAMAIFGNVITSLSWFGVNMLGVGLHSYGFMDSAFRTLAVFIASQAVLVALCFVPPLRTWWAERGAVA